MAQSDEGEVNATFRSRFRENGSNGPGAVLNAEFFRQSIVLEPERALMHQILLTGMEDLSHHAIGIRIEAAQWVDGDASHLFSCQSICETLNIDYPLLRRILHERHPQAWIDAKALQLPKPDMPVEHRRTARKQQRAMAIEMLWDGWDDEVIADRCNMTRKQVLFLRKSRGIE